MYIHLLLRKPTLHLRQAAVWDGKEFRVRDLAIRQGQFASFPTTNAHEINLAGYFLLPAFLNAHDHLELNHYPRAVFRDCYPNAHLWGEEVNTRLDQEPFKSLRAYALWDKAFIGALKNLLCGVTTVIQHGTPHTVFFRADFPVRVPKEYEWAHSLHFSTAAEIQRSYQSDKLWFIHLAEGTDATATSEYARLQALGCVGATTVLIHGVGLTAADIADAAPRLYGLIVCPTTNQRLLGQVADLKSWQQCGGKIALGSDSRLTADGDWLAEVAAVQRIWGIGWQDVLRWQNTFLDGQRDWGANADFVVLKQPEFPHQRADIAAVIKGGIPQIGDLDLMAKFSFTPTVDVILDGIPKRIYAPLARQIQRCALQENGLVFIKRRFWGLF